MTTNRPPSTKTIYSMVNNSDKKLLSKEDYFPLSKTNTNETASISVNNLASCDDKYKAQPKTEDNIKKRDVNWYHMLLRFVTLSSLILMFYASTFFTLELLLFSLVVIDIFLFYEYQTLEYSLLLLPMECIDNVNNFGGYSSLAMSTIFAGCWAIGQSVLSWQFLLELFDYISVSIGFALPLLYWKVAVIAFATAIITFMLGQKAMDYDICEEIFNPTKISNNSEITDKEKYYIQICKLVLLALTYYSIVGYSLEWTLALTAFAPYLLVFIVVAIASLTISRFIVKRVNRTVDEIAKLIKKIEYHEMIIKLISYSAICFLVFSILHIIPFSWTLIEISADIIFIFGFIEYWSNDRLLDDLAERIMLIAHAAGESLIPTAGMSVILPWYMLPVFALMLTIFEVMTDSCHEDEEDTENKYSYKFVLDDGRVYDYPNLKNIGVDSKSLSAYFNDIDCLERLGYDDLKSIPGCGWKSSSRVKKDIAKIVSEHKKYISIERAVNLICLSKQTDDTYRKLIKCGFSHNEIIDANVLSSEELKKHSINKHEDISKELKKHSINNHEYISLQLADVIFLTIFSVIFIKYNVAILTIGLSIITYYAVLLLNVEEKYDLKYKKIISNIVYRTCALTCFSLGITGGLECLKVFGASIYVAIVLAVFGVLIESSVYFDELMKSEHNHAGIFDFIPKLDSVVVCSVILSALSFSLYNIAIFCNITLITSIQIAIIVFPLITRSLYDNFLISYRNFKENSSEKENSSGSEISIASSGDTETKSMGIVCKNNCYCCLPNEKSKSFRNTNSPTAKSIRFFAKNVLDSWDMVSNSSVFGSKTR